MQRGRSKKDEDRRRKEEEARRKRSAERERLRQKKLDVLPEGSAENLVKMSDAGELLIPWQFENTLPEIPSEPKLLHVPLNVDRLVQYRYDSAIEVESPYRMSVDRDLGIKIDLVDPSIYTRAPGATLDPADEELLRMAEATERSTSAAIVRSKRAEVTWLRKTPLIGNNLYDQVHKHDPKEHVERVGHVAKLQNSTAVSARERSLADFQDAIEKQFEEAAQLVPGKVTHPTKPHLVAMAVLPILPDEACWGNNYTMMKFDVNPALAQIDDAKPTHSRARLERAVVKGHATGGRDGQPKQEYVSYLLPKEEGAEEVAEDGVTQTEPTHMEWVREYAFEAKPRREGQPEYVFAIDDEAVLYNTIDSTLHLTRKSFRPVATRPSKITLKRRQPDESEVAEQKKRRQRLGTQMQLLEDKS